MTAKSNHPSKPSSPLHHQTRATGVGVGLDKRYINEDIVDQFAEYSNRSIEQDMSTIMAHTAFSSQSSSGRWKNRKVVEAGVDVAEALMNITASNYWVVGGRLVEFLCRRQGFRKVHTVRRPPGRVFPLNQ